MEKKSILENPEFSNSALAVVKLIIANLIYNPDDAKAALKPLKEALTDTMMGSLITDLEFLVYSIQAMPKAALTARCCKSNNGDGVFLADCTEGWKISTTLNGHTRTWLVTKDDRTAAIYYYTLVQRFNQDMFNIEVADDVLSTSRYNDK